MTQVKFTVTDNMPSLLVNMAFTKFNNTIWASTHCLLECMNNKDADQLTRMSDQRLFYLLIG